MWRTPGPSMMTCAGLVVLISASSLSTAELQGSLDQAWLRNATATILADCRLNSTDPKASRWVMFSPNGGPGPWTSGAGNWGKHYQGQWIVDGYYALSNGWELIDHTEAVVSVRHMLSLARSSDGAIPQMVSPSGTLMYGQEAASLALDSAPFAARTLVMVTGYTNLSFFNEYAPVVNRALLATNLSSRGLVWNDGSAVGYAFHDAVMKSHEVLYCSLLFFDAARGMSRLYNATGQTTLAHQ